MQCKMPSIESLGTDARISNAHVMGFHRMIQTEEIEPPLPVPSEPTKNGTDVGTDPLDASGTRYRRKDADDSPLRVPRTGVVRSVPKQSFGPGLQAVSAHSTNRSTPSRSPTLGAQPSALCRREMSET